MTDGKFVKTVQYNWFATNTDGEEYDTATTAPSRYQVKQIVYHEPQGTGDQHYADIERLDGSIYRVFNINLIEFYKKGEFNDKQGV